MEHVYNYVEDEAPIEDYQTKFLVWRKIDETSKRRWKHPYHQKWKDITEK